MYCVLWTEWKLIQFTCRLDGYVLPFQVGAKTVKDVSCTGGQARNRTEPWPVTGNGIHRCRILLSSSRNTITISRYNLHLAQIFTTSWSTLFVCVCFCFRLPTSIVVLSICRTWSCKVTLSAADKQQNNSIAPVARDAAAAVETANSIQCNYITLATWTQLFEAHLNSSFGGT